MNPDRRTFLRLAGASLCAAATSCAGIAPRRAPQPNIVLCMADDQGWGDMAYNGHPVLQTPNFDQMAAEAVRFDRFYAAAPVCSPTRGSVMTGRHPNRFGCFKWGYTLREGEVTVAEALRAAGYVTGHFGKWHLGSVREGSPVNPGANGFDEWFSAPNFFDNDPILSREGQAVQTEGESSMVTADAAIEFIRKHAASPEPFLAVVWFGSPHSPHSAIERDREPYQDQSEKLQNFYGEITGMDRAFGKLRNELRELDIHENTVLWYCSDNGGLPKVGSTGGRADKGEIYEGGLRVPALFEWPGTIPQPAVTDVACVTSDIYPTVLDLAGVYPEYQPPLDGINLRPVLEGSMKRRPEPIGFWDRPAPGYRTPSHEWMTELLEAQKRGEKGDPERLRLGAEQVGEQYPLGTYPGHSAWLDWPWKLHRKEEGEAVTFELYDLENDPMEQEDLVERESERAEAMKPALQEWLESVVRSLNGEDYK